jgi:hypothetical protein
MVRSFELTRVNDIPAKKSVDVSIFPRRVIAPTHFLARRDA